MLKYIISFFLHLICKQPQPANLQLEVMPPAKMDSIIQPGDYVEWIIYPPQKEKSSPRWGTVLTDIENHLPASYGTQYQDSDPVTHGHETSHGIHSELRNNWAKRRRANGLYCLDHKAAIVDDPKITIKQVADLVPSSLRGMRYNLYLVKQRGDWNDIPTYILDEWIAYINGAEVGISQYKENLTNNSSTTDVCVAPLEFTYYVLTLCLAIEKYDSNYLETNKQFREFVAFNIRRSHRVYNEGMQIPHYKWDTKLPSEFAGESGTELRRLANKLYGQEFVNSYLLSVK